MSWANELASIDAAILAEFSADTPITYTPKVGDSFTITAVWGVRLPDETEKLAAFERIWTTSDQLQGYVPQTGDTVSIGSPGNTTDYFVQTVKPDTDPSGTGMRIYLQRRAVQPT